MGSGSSKPTSIPLASDFNKPGGNSISVQSLISYVPTPPTGKRLALIMGNNYTGTNNELSGCINDANKIKNILSAWGFTTTLMTDLASGDLKITYANILSKLDSHLTSLDTNDTLVIYYSGHGSLVNDTNNDELSGKDSVIVPIDYKSAGYIKDDTLRTELLKATKGNVFCVFDSCNSGSVCDLRYALLATVYRTIISTKKFYDPKEWKKSIDIATNTNYPETNTQIISLSGSSDTQFSYEIQDSNGNWGGALTYALINTLSVQTPKVTITDLVIKVRTLLNSWGRPQTPSLMSGQAFADENLKFSEFIGI
jgi:hypothetical protein